MVCTEAVGWQVEGKVNFGLNVMSYLLMLGGVRGYNTRKGADCCKVKSNRRDLKVLSVAHSMGITSLNIWVGLEGILKAALLVLKQGNVDVGALQWMNLTKEIHTQFGAGYAIWAMQAKI